MDRILQNTEIFQLEAFLASSENTRMDEETININNKATLFKTKDSSTSICWRSHFFGDDYSNVAMGICTIEYNI